MDSDEEQLEQEMMPLSLRPEWSDVKPIRQDDGPNLVVPTSYEQEFRETIDCFRAIYSANELSPRALQLAHEAILNPGNYMVPEVLFLQQGSCCRLTIFTCRNFHSNAAKAPQLPAKHHRRWVAQKLGTSLTSKELDFTRKILSPDPINYHARSHRQALGGREDELDYCWQLLEENIYNNCAWNQAMRNSEVSCTVEAIMAYPDNESPWRYLRGLYKNDTGSWINDPRVSSICLKVSNTQGNYVFALSTLLDLLCHGFQPSQDFREAIDALTPEYNPADSDLAKAICDVLEQVDIMRASYWSWRNSKLSPVA